MNKLLQELKNYYKNTSREQIERDWEETKKYDQIGPTLEEFFGKKNTSDKFAIVKEDFTDFYKDKEGKVKFIDNFEGAYDFCWINECDRAYIVEIKCQYRESEKDIDIEEYTLKYCITDVHNRGTLEEYYEVYVESKFLGYIPYIEEPTLNYIQNEINL